MEKLILILVSSVHILFSCSNSSENGLQETKRTVMVKPIKKTYYPKEYDQSIKNICNLFESKSLNQEVFGDYEKFLFHLDELFIVNKTSYCKLHIANGGAKGEFQSVTVGLLNDLPKNMDYKGIIYKHDFKTNNNIILGMSVEEFNKQIPKSIELNKTVKGNTILINVKDSFNTYEANYKFYENQLINFNFGYSED